MKHDRARSLFVGAVTGATLVLAGSSQTASAAAAAGKTYIFIGNRAAGYVQAYGDGRAWDASWTGDRSIEAWVERGGRGGYVAYCESVHRGAWGEALRSSVGTWVVSDRTGRLGTLHKRSSSRWDIFDRRCDRIGYTRGMAGVPAGLAWLALRTCHV